MAAYEYPGFPLSDLDQEPAEPLGVPTVRTRIEAPCPGRFENTVVLLRGRQVQDGLRRPKNIGTCLLHIACYDSSGAFIGTFHLAPRESFDSLTFPSNTEVVRMGCDRSCNGT